jgi:hypothetical protein
MPPGALWTPDRARCRCCTNAGNAETVSVQSVGLMGRLGSSEEWDGGAAGVVIERVGEVVEQAPGLEAAGGVG